MFKVCKLCFLSEIVVFPYCEDDQRRKAKFTYLTLNMLDFPQACIFDWAGTVCDAGVFAPVLTFQKLFEDEGVPITTEEVRAPMGVHKRVSTNYIFIM